jgi:hypothetical protein
MTVGWGVDATKSGSVVTSGTLASDVRKVWGALFTAGIISGCGVTTSSSQMDYTVTSGVVAIQTAVGEVVMAPVQGTTVPTGAAPGTGSRVDVIFVQQRFPTDGDSYVSVRVLPFANEAAVALPPNSQELKRYLVSAGQTNTNAAVFIGDIDYSIPYGSSLGVLWEYKDTYNGPLPAVGSPIQRKGHKTIYLPTDRRLRFSIQSTLYAIGAVGFDNSKYCEYGFLPSIDGGDFVLWTTPGLHQAHATYQWVGYFNATAGNHDVNFGGFHASGPGQAFQLAGVHGGFGRTGTVFTVEDAGPVV